MCLFLCQASNASVLSHEATAAYAAVVVALFALVISIAAYFQAHAANVLQRNIAKRQGVIDLHNAWKGINEIDPNTLIGPDVISAVNALDLTSSLWNHDVIEKQILFQSYWHPFQQLYSALATNHNLVPGKNKQAREFISQPIHLCHQKMMDLANANVRQTTI